jgi:hypothetical protein
MRPSVTSKRGRPSGIKVEHDKHDERPDSAKSCITGSNPSKAMDANGKGQAVVKVKQKATKKLPRLGAMAPEDPFFWFCAQNFALYTYPADCIPKHYLGDGSSLVYHYSDIVSRTGTPEVAPGSHRPKRGSIGSDAGDDAGDDFLRTLPPAPIEGGTRVLQDNTIVPPSICLCQPTEITAQPKQRWEITLEFVDDRGSILGDTGWFPGALGHRFTFEARPTYDNCNYFLRLSEVPQGQVLYMEHVKLSRADLKAKAKTRGPHKDLWASDSSSGLEGCSPSGSDVSGTSSRGGKAANQRRRRAPTSVFGEKKVAGQAVSMEQASKKSESLMLPPLLSTLREA